MDGELLLSAPREVAADDQDVCYAEDASCSWWKTTWTQWSTLPRSDRSYEGKLPHVVHCGKADRPESDAPRDDEETQGSRTRRCSEDDAGHDGWWRCTRRRTWWDGYRKYDEVHDGRWRWRWGYAQYGSDAG